MSIKDDPIYIALMETKSDLKEMISTGFAGVHERQDKTNGNVKRNTAFRLETEGALKFIKFCLGLLGFGNIIIILAYFFNR